MFYQIERFFQLRANHTSIKTEVLAGLATFLTMSYIIFVNPGMLAQTGMDEGAVFVATCLSAAFGCTLMGLLANYPIALAPGMALNAYFTYGVVLGAGRSWQSALGAVFISGLIFLAISILPIREYIVNCIPKSLKLAIVAGIGLFLGVIGLKNAGIIIASQATLVKLGNLHDPKTLLAIAGFMLIIGFEALHLAGAVIISILLVTIASILFGYSDFFGVFSIPPSILPTFMQLDVKAALSLGLATIVFAFLFVDLFDNTGTLIGIAYRAGFMTKDGKLPRISRALLADSTAAVAGAVLGTSTTTSYLESTVGVNMGARTGLMAITVAVLFLLATFISPLAKSIPIYATAPVLVYVACLMTHAITEIDWNDVTEYAPAMITVITMPLTFSVSDGIAFGFITYVMVKMLSGRFRELNPAIFVLAMAFIFKYVLM